ncbi:MAG: hypothetical protein IT199_02940, partial [Solirubrobacterales bacterium]|nr:hypothetical protein [Solirubrobacterales bacterium]
LVDIVPLTEAEFVKAHKDYGGFLAMGRQVAFAQSWLNPKNIRQRVQWKSAHPEQDEKAPASPSPMDMDFGDFGA